MAISGASIEYLLGVNIEYSTIEDVIGMAEDKVELAVRQRMGFFGFAVGVSLYFLMVIVINLIPPVRDLVILISPRYELPWNYIMLFVTPLMWGAILFFVPYRKSKF